TSYRFSSKSTPFPYSTLFRAGFSVAATGAVMLVPAVVSFLVGDREAASGILAAAAISVAVGSAAGMMAGRPGEIGMKDGFAAVRSEEHTSELQSRENLVCRLL